MNYLELFSGAGGGILAHSILHKMTPVGASEKFPYPNAVLAARQDDGSLPSFPLLGPVEGINGHEFRGIDMVAGGFPCQGLSLAGLKKWLKDERTELVWEMMRVCKEAEPGYIFAENVPALRNHMDILVEVLQNLGYGRIAWMRLSAGDIGAPHERYRLWLMAKRTRRHAPTSTVKLPEKVPYWGMISDGIFEPLTYQDVGIEGKDRRVVLPTLLTSDARKSGNRPGAGLWSLCDRLGLTRKGERLKILPTLAATDWKSPYSSKGLDKQLAKRSKPLRDMLPYYFQGHHINPKWAEWYMGWPPGWTDLAPLTYDLRRWKIRNLRDTWWTALTERSVLPPTLPAGAHPKHHAKRLKALGNGQVPMVAALAFDVLREWVDG